MSLTEYRRKRRFDTTREPSPDVRPAKPRKRTRASAAPEVHRPIFVVQLHHASRRHYDFRLQIGDALKSWAVPKGPSYDPKIKRMAVEVEDHPLSYATFEGNIPEGEYGGGHVALFDEGVWTTPWDPEAQLAKGHLRFELFGERLKGEWHLVRSGKPARQPQWLLFKEADAYAGSIEADDLLDGVTQPPAAKKSAAKTATKSATKAAKTATKTATKKAAAKTVVPKRRKVDWSAKAAKLTNAKKATLRNEAFAPQLAKLGDAAPSGDQWIHEVKWDGYRLVSTIVDGKVRIWSRNAIEWTGKVPELRAALEQLGLRSGAFDGELIAGRGTQADFNLLQATLSGEQQGALAYVLFDVLHVDGIDVRKAPLIERKALLEAMLETPIPHMAYSTHVPGGEGAAAFALASEQQFEGIISKRADRPYVAGRGDDWRKTKRLDSDEFAVVGVTKGQGSRTGFGSLLLARPDAKHGWVYAGRVGTGFSTTQLRDLAKHIGEIGSSTPSVHVPIPLDAELKRAKWFDPLFVVEVFIRGLGSSGILRQPSLKTVRMDKDVADLRDSDRGATSKQSAKKATKKTASKSTARERAPAPEVRLSSPTKIIFPDRNITKQQVADYYKGVAPHLLREIAGRPLSVIRCPDGVGKACFFQKHHTAGLEIVRFVRLKEEAGINANYLVVDDVAGLMELVQFNALEFHPWGAHADDPDCADRVIFDLDPGPGVAFAEVKRSAAHVRDLLQQLGLQSFLRATGGKGLHVVVPLKPANDWKLVKKFAKGFAEALAASDPDRWLATATLKLRPGKIFVDYLRNGRGATAVASYSLRARAGAPCAVPLAWRELAALKRGDAFDVDATLARIKGRRKDPWADIDTLRQDLSAWG
ncbi:DNA ligase D [Lysobacter sp. A6]|uniref:DNA ligase (ATP) n=1 Tax=Noviluteimonas lactosilytica TaxID=2888523 RepID=A0ABS8JDS7_9GAMM|nr:DNA ligase D [Lysobacter lactosilyticus]MCC8361665.1 DNA ligase D [Lysobacter lactosilyticus]